MTLAINDIKNFQQYEIGSIPANFQVNICGL